MLDENLPTFVLKHSQDKPKQNSTFLYSQHGADFQPAYNLRHLDPEQHASKNRYAVALYDAFNPEVLFGEVLLIPEWTHPTLNQEQIRANGGVPPPPEPILPTEFAIQLYNPDLQVTVRHKSAGLTSAEKWEFEIPQTTFRVPSTSTLDRGQHDPSAIEHTPKLSLKWKKDGRLSKDLACYLSGKAYNPDGSKKKQKEPDITIAIFKNLKEVTMYEPNMARVEVEDAKGFEIVLLLGAVVIRDVYFGTMKETFNINSAVRKSSTPVAAANVTTSAAITKPQASLPLRPNRDPRVPPTDPRSQWEIDAETQRLRRETAEEQKRLKAKDEAEQRRLKKMLDAEEKERKRKQAEVDKETERLRKLYGKEDSSARPRLPTRPVQQQQQQPNRNSAYASNSHVNNNQNYSNSNAYNYGNANANLGAGPYMSGAASQSTFLRPQPDPALRQKTSLFSFRRHSDHEDPNKLQRKRSAVW